jgi:long-chain acyl-CoA synthetase
VEKVLKDHPAVLEVVAGIAHPEKEGQEAQGLVVRKPAMTLLSRSWPSTARFLAPYEVPRRIAFVQELPKSAVGKTLRRELVRMEQEEQAATGSPA